MRAGAPTDDLLAALPPEVRAQVRSSPQPEWIPPMLATLTQRRFSSPDWIFERKLDGERCLGFLSDAGVRLLSRNRRRLDGTYPEIAGALAAATEHELVVDGEVVAFEGDRTSFARLQRRIGISDPALARRSGVAVTYFLFDVLHLDGHDVTGVPLRHRKSLLRRALTFGSPLRFTVHRDRDGERFVEEACRRGWEGLVAKRADSPYVAGRSRDWLKLKCSNRQEMVVGGFTDPRGSRVGFGALLLGHHDGGRLVYAGKVGTGYDTATLGELRSRLDALEQPQNPFAGAAGRQAGVHWVRPELVAEVEFTEWTGDGRLRHPRFVGLRDDKPAAEVVRERALETPG
ncbi:MAG TPA: non-homologous end-joining DNA ligase [Candidatus Dormibacteraeota bacterium]